MNKKEYMKPLMKVVKIKAHRLLSVSNDVGLHNEVSDKNSY